MRSLPALVYARGSMCAWATAFVRSNERGELSARGNVPVTEKRAGGDAFEFRRIATTRQVLVTCRTELTVFEQKNEIFS